MQLEHSFTLPVGIDEAWRTLRDIGAIAGSMPGSTVDTASADRAAGTLKVKLGPLNLNYKGAAELVEADEAARRAVVAANGDTARNGNATARVVATLAADGEATTVRLATELDVTGKPAQFTHSVMTDVGTRMVMQFAAALSEALTAGSLTPSSAVVEPDTVPEQEVVLEPESVVMPESVPEQEPESVPEPETPPEAVVIAAEDDAIPSVNGHGGTTSAVAPARPTPPSASRGLTGLVRPALIRGVAPLAIAALLVLGALRRRHRQS